MKSLNDLKILLLQIREDEETRREELLEFVRYSGLNESQFSILDVFNTSHFDANVVAGFDALFVGGSSDASVLNIEQYPFVNDCKSLLRHCYDADLPVLASCFGFQVVVEELGGKVHLDKEHMEMGIYPIRLTEKGQQDPLFANTPNEFMAVSGHKERAIRIPDHCDVLATSDLCPYHIIKFHHKPFYAFQFHPEVDRDDLISRISRYQYRYLDNDEHLQSIIKCMTHDTPHANQIIADFITKIIL